MPFLWLLPDSKDARYVSVIVVLGILLIMAGRKIIQQKSEIAALPKIEVRFRDRIVERVRIVKEIGPEHIVIKTVTEPGGTVTVEKEIIKDRIVIETQDAKIVERASEKTETPGSSFLAPAKPWSVEASVNPLEYQHNAWLGLSRSFGVLRIGYAHIIDPAVKFNDGHRINLGIPLF